jgi:hypothetical protein
LIFRELVADGVCAAAPKQDFDRSRRQLAD